MILNTHHISYDPEWTVEITNYEHKCISIIQRTKGTEEVYAILTNFMHALQYEHNRIREELDTGKDLRMKK